MLMYKIIEISEMERQIVKEGTQMKKQNKKKKLGLPSANTSSSGKPNRIFCGGFSTQLTYN